MVRILLENGSLASRSVCLHCATQFSSLVFVAVLLPSPPLVPPSRFFCLPFSLVVPVFVSSVLDGVFLRLCLGSWFSAVSSASSLDCLFRRFVCAVLAFFPLNSPRAFHSSCALVNSLSQLHHPLTYVPSIPPSCVLVNCLVLLLVEAFCCPCFSCMVLRHVLLVGVVG